MGEASHFCALALGILGVAETSRCGVSTAQCEVCCSQRAPRAESPNPLVATIVYKAARGIKETGGVEGCDASQAGRLMAFAVNFLLSLDAILRARRSAPAPAAYTGLCRYLGRKVDSQISNANGAEPVFACHHPLHRESTIPKCRKCADYQFGEGRHCVESWAIGMTTASRSPSTLQRSMRSLRRAGWKGRVHLFAEQSTPLPPNGAGLSRVSVLRRNGPALGAWGNFLLGLAELCLREPRADAYLMLQDDVLYCRGLRDYLESALWPGPRPGVISLHTARHLAPNAGTGWFHADLGWSTWGAQAFIFSNASARAFLADPVTMNHRLKGLYDGKKNVDSVVGAWCRRSKHEFWLHAPSLAEHIGASSTLWPKATLEGGRSSADFPGDKRPIMELLTEHGRAHGEDAPPPIRILTDGTVEQISKPAGPHGAPDPRGTLEASIADAQSVVAVKSASNTPGGVSVVVICHAAYLPRLNAALASVDAQRLSFRQRILVLDRVPESAVPVRADWTILRVEAGNPNVARNTGLNAVNHGWVVFWDADNRMPSGYLERAGVALTKCADNVAFLYPHIRYVNEDGMGVKEFEVPDYDYWLMREKAFVDSSSLWRAAALRAVGGWSERQNCLDDYELALRLTRNGWRGRPSYSWTSITQHASRRSQTSDTRRALWNAWTLGVVTLWGGRSPVMEQLLQWYASVEMPPQTRLYWLDNTGSAAQRRKLDKAAATMARRVESVTLIDGGDNYPLAPGESYLTWGRHQHVANLYNLLLPRVGEDLVLFVEDDNLPGTDSLRQLHECMTLWGKVAGVGAVYRSRNTPDRVCASLDLEAWRAPLISSLPPVPVPAGMLGGGCTLYWNSALKKALPFLCTFHTTNGSLTGWDGNLGRALTSHNYKLLLHGGVHVDHRFDTR